MAKCDYGQPTYTKPQSKHSPTLHTFTACNPNRTMSRSCLFATNAVRSRSRQSKFRCSAKHSTEGSDIYMTPPRTRTNSMCACAACIPSPIDCKHWCLPHFLRLPNCSQSNTKSLLICNNVKCPNCSCL
jgi:hypothetical protein